MSYQRNEVRYFADVMEAELRQNDPKGGWKACSTAFLSNKLLEEVAELLLSLDTQSRDDYELIGIFVHMIRRLRKTQTEIGTPRKEAADVANIAMMLTDPERFELAKASEQAVEKEESV